MSTSSISIFNPDQLNRRKLAMNKSRTEAFSDGVIAIIVTIMVLELKSPHVPTLAGLAELTPIFLSYVLSFVVVACMWVNHHHLLYTVTSVDGALLWANNHLLFWMSLIPFVTNYMGENHGDAMPVSLYGLVLVGTTLGFMIMQHLIRVQHQSHVVLRAQYTQMVKKSLYTALAYLAAALLAWVSVWLAYAIYVLIPLLYFIPERKLTEYGAETN
jgi:uncharacterized membrane protein